MTANYSTGNGFYGANSYTIQKEKAKVLVSNNLFSTNPRGISKEMRDQAQDSRTPKPVLHASFSFHPSEKISNEKGIQAVEKALDNVGITKDNYQYTIVRHADTKNPHFHVVANRVGLDGKTHNAYYLSDRLQASCDKVEKDLGLRRTDGRTVVWDESQKLNFKVVRQKKKDKAIRTKKQGVKATKNHIKTEVSASLKTAKDWNELKSDLEKKGIELDVKTNKNGVYGMSFKTNNIAVKASSIGVKVKDTKKIFAENYKEYNRAKTIEKHEIKDLVEREIKEGIKEYKTIYAENSKKIDRYKNMMNEKMISKKSSQELAEKYDLKEKPFLDDLNALDKADNESTAKVDKIAQERENTYKTLMNTKEEKSGIFTSSQKKAEIESRNRELRLSRSDARMNLLNDHDKVALKGQFVNERMKEITGQRISAMRENTRNEIKDLENYYKVALNVDLRAEIAKREQTRGKDQEKEKNREKSRGYGR